MAQIYECSECHKDMASECECFTEAVLDCQTKLDDLMELVARSDIIKKLEA